MSHFTVQVDFKKNHKATRKVLYIESPGSLQSIFGTPRKYWTQVKKEAWDWARQEGFLTSCLWTGISQSSQYQQLIFLQTVKSR